MQSRTIGLTLAALTALIVEPACSQDGAANGEVGDLVQQVELEKSLEAARAQMEAARAQLETAARQFALRGVENGNFVTVAPSGSSLIMTPLEGLRVRTQLGVQIVDARGGALVTQVVEGGAADDAGVEVGDVITSIDGVDLANGTDAPIVEIRSRLGAIEPGAIVALVVEREGARLDLEVEAQADSGAGLRFFSAPEGADFRVFTTQVASAAREAGAAARAASAEAAAVARTARAVNPARVFSFAAAPWGDMELVPMTPALGRYFETTEGLLVVRAPSDASIGLQDGDVILEIGDRTPTSPEHALRILGSFDSGETVVFALMRNGRSASVNYTVTESAVAPRAVQIYAPAPAPAAVTPTSP